MAEPAYRFGALPGLPRGSQQLVRWLLGLGAAERYLNQLPLDQDLQSCLAHILEDKQIHHEALRAAASDLPASGPLLVASNHPTGILDGIVLIYALQTRRSDVFVYANHLLTHLPLLGPRIVPVDLQQSPRAAARSLRLARSHWQRGDCVVAFPAGTVEHWQWKKRGIREAPWAAAIQKLARKAGVPEIRAHLRLHNPSWFQVLAAVSRACRSVALLRAFLHAPEPQAKDAVLSFDEGGRLRE